MTLMDTTATQAPTGIDDQLRARLREATMPLKLAEVMKGIPKPRKLKAPEFQAQARAMLDEQIRQGQAFRHPSGKGGVERWWSRDEKQMLRAKALELAVTPMPMMALKNKLSKEIKGTDPAFVEAVLREMHGDGKLHEHPAKSKSSGPLYGASPAPPRLELPKARKAADRLLADARKLLASSGASLDDLVAFLRQHMPAAAAPIAEGPAPAMPRELDELILKAVANEPSQSLPELRGTMPAEFRGQAFDEAVLRLAGAQRVVLSEHPDPASLSDDERSRHVSDGQRVYRNIAKRE